MKKTLLSAVLLFSLTAASTAFAGETAVESPSQLFINGQKVSLTSYQINGYHYFKLRDLGEALNFAVSWDPQFNSVLIDGDSPYYGQDPISPEKYQSLLGKGMDVDWSKTTAGMETYTPRIPKDFAAAGIQHVRIRIKDAATQELLDSLEQQIDDCLNHGLIPVIAYQADELKREPSAENIQKAVEWWTAVAERLKDKSSLLSFDLLIEATDALNQQPEKLNELYEALTSAVRQSNPDRIVMISPRLRSDPQYLQELKIPSQHNGYLMAEWHFYASGPSKTNERKLWTKGSQEEKKLIEEKISLALKWQEQTGIPTWVGAWMPGNYNDGDDYSIPEQVAFAGFMTSALTDADIPFAVNSDTKFYDASENAWLKSMQPVFDAIFSK